MNTLINTITILKQGGIIAYPTESVYGLGCDAFNEQAVMRLLSIKKRPIEKGLILIASEWSQVSALVQPLTEQILQPVFVTWPGPVTWVFPASPLAPHWICGAHDTIAIRLTAHPIARKLCQLFNHPIVSTSANLDGQPPAKTAQAVKTIFNHELDFIVDAPVGNLAKPTEIRDVLTHKILRDA